MQEWGHEVLYLHVDAANVKAITFYKNIGFASVERDSRWFVHPHTSIAEGLIHR